MRLLVISLFIFDLAVVVTGCGISRKKSDPDDFDAVRSRDADGSIASARTEITDGGFGKATDANSITTGESNRADHDAYDRAFRDRQSNNRDNDVLGKPLDKRDEADDSDAGDTDPDDYRKVFCITWLRRY